MKNNIRELATTIIAAIAFAFFYTTKTHIATMIGAWYIINLTLPSIIIEKIA